MRKFPIEYEEETDTESLITPKQVQTLTELIYTHVSDEDEREDLLSRVSCMSMEEAYNLILEFSLSFRM